MTANISLIDAHWFFLVAVDFYDEKSKNKNSVEESIRFYLFDSMHNQKDVIMKHKNWITVQCSITFTSL